MVWLPSERSICMPCRHFICQLLMRCFTLKTSDICPISSLMLLLVHAPLRISSIVWLPVALKCQPVWRIRPAVTYPLCWTLLLLLSMVIISSTADGMPQQTAILMHTRFFVVLLISMVRHIRTITMKICSFSMKCMPKKDSRIRPASLTPTIPTPARSIKNRSVLSRKS